MTEILTRAFEVGDAEQVTTLWRTVFADDPPHNEPSAVLSSKLSMGDGLLFVAELKGDIVGAIMAGYDGHRGWLYTLAVLPGYRRRGVGQALVNTAIEALRKLGCIKVNLQIRAGNHAVTAFYRSLGFAVEDRISMGKLLKS